MATPKASPRPPHDRVALDAIRHLRGLPRLSFITPDGMSEISNRYKHLFRDLAETLSLDSVVLIPFHRRTFGDLKYLSPKSTRTDFWTNVFRSESTPSSAHDRLILPLKARHSKHDAEPLAYVGLQRGSGFTRSDRTLLHEVCQFVADDLIDQYTVLRSERLRKLQGRLEAYHANIRAGTVLSGLTAHLHRALYAYSTCAVILDQGHVAVEYFAHGAWNGNASFPKTVATQELKSEALVTLLQKRRIATWSDIGQERPLEALLRPHIPGCEGNWTYLLVTVREGKAVLGAMIFQFPAGTVPEFDAISVPLLSLIDDASRYFRFLFQRRTRKMIVEPIYKSRDTKVDENTVFIMMPFSEPWSNRIWQKIVRPHFEKQGFAPKRADDMYGQDIMEDIWKGILSSRFAVADVTGRNPNVFYELGLAHAIGKPVILLTQKVGDIPFDLNRYRHIVYEDNADGYEVLERQLAQTVRTLITESTHLPKPAA